MIGQPVGHQKVKLSAEIELVIIKINPIDESAALRAGVYAKLPMQTPRLMNDRPVLGERTYP